MSDKTRRAVTTIETHEVWVVRRPADVANILCADCPGADGMLTPEQAAHQAGVSQRTIHRWIEDGRIHFAETANGGLFVCLAPLLLEEGAQECPSFIPGESS